MKQHLMVCGLVMLLVCVGMSGCSNLASDKDKFVGTWKAANGTTSVLFSDGTCTIAGITGTWEIKDTLLVIKLANLPTQSTFSYVFSNGDKTVTLTDIGSGIALVYTKQ